MRRAVLLIIAVLSVSPLPGCTWDTVKRSVLGSMYTGFGEGYGGDRMSDFNQRYDDQSKAAEEYCQQHQ